jgi:Zn-dependent protease
LDIHYVQVFISFIVLLFSLTIHEMAHAWTADRLGDPTARLLGRVSLNPLVHADPVGTILMPLVAAFTGLPLLGWAKPVPVNVRNLHHHRRDYLLVVGAGPASNIVMAIVASLLLAAIVPVSPVRLGEPNITAPLASLLSLAIQINVLLAVFNMIPIPPLDGGNLVIGLLPDRLSMVVSRVRQYGFLILYALILSGGLDKLVLPPYFLLVSWLPTR